MKIIKIVTHDFLLRFCNKTPYTAQPTTLQFLGRPWNFKNQNYIKGKQNNPPFSIYILKDTFLEGGGVVFFLRTIYLTGWRYKPLKQLWTFSGLFRSFARDTQTNKQTDILLLLYNDAYDLWINSLEIIFLKTILQCNMHLIIFLKIQ